MQVVDPLIFVRGFVPADIISGTGRAQLDLGGEDTNDGPEFGLLNDITSALTPVAAKIAEEGKDFIAVQSAQLDFEKGIIDYVTGERQWGTLYGLKLVKVAPTIIPSEKTEQFNNQMNANRIENAAKVELGQQMSQGGVADAYAKVKMAEGMATGIAEAGKQGGMNMTGLAMNMNAMGQTTGMNMAGFGGNNGAINGAAMGASAAMGAMGTMNAQQQPQQPVQPAQPQAPVNPENQTPAGV